MTNQYLHKDQLPYLLGGTLLAILVSLCLSFEVKAQGTGQPITYLTRGGGFESEELVGWTGISLNGGVVRTIAEGVCHSANNTVGITLDGDYAAKLRPSSAAPTNSISVLTSDPFLAGDKITFKALTENNAEHPFSDPVTLEVRLLDADTGNILMQLSDVDANTVLLESTLPGCTTGVPHNGQFSLHEITTSPYKNQSVRLEFRHHTNIASWGFFTLIDEVTISGTNLLDTDGDALPDDWETNGLTVSVNGVTEFVNLPAMGADPLHKDIFVEIDWMGESDDYSHAPSAMAIEMIVNSFNNASVNNLDGTTGIHLHVDYGADSPLTWGDASTWGALSDGEDLPHATNIDTCIDNAGNLVPFNWANFDAIKLERLTTGRKAIFHYSIWAHHLCDGYAATSGISREAAGASDFIVSLGSWERTDREQAGTFMHELGHNLGLRHGGEDNENWKPNYLSVMNYAFQTRGLTLDGESGYFDYSSYDLPDLNEIALNETIGLSLPGAVQKKIGTSYFCGLDELIHTLDARHVDWNCSGQVENTVVSANINQGMFWNNNSTLDLPLTSWNDWENLIFNGGAIGKPGVSVTLPQTTEIMEITVEQDALIPDLISAPILSSAPDITLSQNWGSGFGTAVANAGDVNGDGFVDLIVGEPRYTVLPNNFNGRVFLYYGSQNGYTNTGSGSWAYMGPNYRDFAGVKVASAGDVNGDGYDDFMILHTSDSQVNGGRGRVALFYGSATGPSASPDWVFEGSVLGSGSNTQMASLGDVNGDNYDDIVITWPYFTDTLYRQGRILVFWGSDTGLNSTPDWTSVGGYIQKLGTSVAAGDLNGDGFQDLLAGAAGGNLIHIYHGSSTGFSSSPDLIHSENIPYSNFGNLVTTGDWNCDGRQDIAVGAPQYSPTGLTEAGRVYVYYNSSLGIVTSSPWVKEGDINYAQFGFGALVSSDLNGDSCDEFILSAANYHNEQNGNGQIWLYEGHSYGLEDPHNWTLMTQWSNQFGRAVASAGDINRDGAEDLLIGFDDGAFVWVFYGAPAPVQIAVDDEISALEDIAIPVDVLANDMYTAGTTLTITGVTQPANGSVTFDINHITYTPTTNFNGQDGFTYTVTNGIRNDSATVSILVEAVNDAPYANDDTAMTDEDTDVTILVLDNDSDIDDDILAVSSVTQPPNGVVINNGYSITYSPDPGFFGSDGFTYTVLDGQGGIATAVVTVTVNEIADFVVLSLLNSSNNGLAGGTAQYYNNGWQNIPGSTNANGLLETTIPRGSGILKFRLHYGGASIDITQNVSVDPMVVFQTTTITVQLWDSNGDPLDTGSVLYYANGWNVFGDTVGGQVSLELLPRNYQFRLHYGGTSIDITQNVNINPLVIFQTTNATVQLRDSYGNPLDTGSAQYYAGGWQAFGDTVGGQVSLELLPKSYKFRLHFAGNSLDITQNVSIDPVVIFQTTNVTVQLWDSNSNPLDTGLVQYYAGGWQVFGDTAGGQVSLELLPKSYKFRLYFGGSSLDITQDVSVDPVVVFQTTNVTVQLWDSNGNPLDTGSVHYYAGGWNVFGDTVGGQASLELLAKSYQFRLHYGGASTDITQDISIDPVVNFQTGQVSSVTGTATFYYAGGWQTFSNGMELLPKAYLLRFEGGYPDTYYTITAGTVNVIH